MQISNVQFGVMEFTEEQVISFDGGLAGFENHKKFLLVQMDIILFSWLVSVDEPELVFPLVPISTIVENFPVDIGTNAFGIVTFNADATKITVNLRAPLYLNTDKNIGYQRLLSKYKTNYPLFVKTEGE